MRSPREGGSGRMTHAPKMCNVRFDGLQAPPGGVNGFSPARAFAGNLTEWQHRHSDGVMRWKGVGRRRVGGDDGGAGGTRSPRRAADTAAVGGAVGSSSAGSNAAEAPTVVATGALTARARPREASSKPLTARALSPPARARIPPAGPPSAPLTHGPQGVGFLDEHGVLQYRRRNVYLSDGISTSHEDAPAKMLASGSASVVVREANKSQETK